MNPCLSWRYITPFISYGKPLDIISIYEISLIRMVYNYEASFYMVNSSDVRTECNYRNLFPNICVIIEYYFALGEVYLSKIYS